MGIKPSKKATELPSPGSSSNQQSPQSTQPIQTFRPVSNLRRHLDKSRPEQEFKAIELYDTMHGTLSSGTTAEAFKDTNKPKNRYAYVVPYDHTRVKLTDNGEDSDYINASHVKGEDVEYICAQGPLPETTVDFWKMIWDQKVPVILMLTKAVENGRIKCHRYYPEKEDDELAFTQGLLRVEPTSFEENEATAITVRKYKVYQTANPQVTREVIHYQYTGWPDHRVPENTEGIRELIDRIDTHLAQIKSNGPIVVHCSAGIGRTGTFCTIHIALNRLKKHLQANPSGSHYKYDVYNTVIDLRKQRTGMVQQPEQYRFCYEAIMDGAIKLGVVFPEKKKKKGSKKHKEDESEPKQQQPSTKKEPVGESESKESLSELYLETNKST